MSKSILVTGALVLLGMLGSEARGAVADDRWLSFQGCWRATDAPAGNLLCIVPDGEGVRLIELADGTIVRETRMTADGQARSISQENCTGTERARWSVDTRRLYIDTQLTCDGQFELSTMFSMISATEWVSIQALAVDNDAATRVIVYEIADPVTGAPESVMTALREGREARERARYSVAKQMTIDEVLEAAKEAHPRAVEALLLVRNQPFALTGKNLLALSDAGVPGYLIDAVVAVSHPELFEVEELPATLPQGQESAGYAVHYRDVGYDPWCNYSYLFYSPYSFGCDDYNCHNSYDWDYRDEPGSAVRSTDSENYSRRASVSPRGYSSGLGRNAGSSDGGEVGGERMSGEPSESNTSSDGSAASSAGSSGSSGSSGATPTSSGSAPTTTGKAKPRDGG